MGNRNILYVVCVSESFKDTPSKVYETTKESRAYDFLKDFTKNNPEIVRAWIDKKYIDNYDKRNYDRYEED